MIVFPRIQLTGTDWRERLLLRLDFVAVLDVAARVVVVEDVGGVAGGGGAGGNVFRNHGAGADGGIVPYADVFDNGDHRAYIDIVADDSGGVLIRPYGKALAEVHVVANLGPGVDDDAARVAYVQAVADFRR